MVLKIGVLTVSDRASTGEYEDKSGPAIVDYFTDVILDDWEYVSSIVPDEIEDIQAELMNMADNQNCNLIITTGGTGPAARDVTPEATEAVCEKILPGFGEQMRMVSSLTVQTAILSRQTAGTRKQSLIINLPGNPKAIKECLDAVISAVPYCVELIGGTFFRIDNSKINTSIL
ncbi:MAG: molybdopterin adenylyltransferase [Phototrophicaceae bacterium]